MSVLFAVFLITNIVKAEYSIPVATIKRNDLATCVSGIINKYGMKEVTYVDIFSDEDILQGIKDNVTNSILSQRAHFRLAQFNENYLIHAGSVSHFINNFHFLTKEATWEPNAKFIIIFNEIEEDIRVVFDVLLKFHVLNALVIHAAGDTHLYTYNSFENYGCGKYYERIISYGKCLQPAVENLFPDKLVTGIRNCTFNVEAWHWPPYAINPRFSSGLKGVEQFLLKILGGIEDFKLNYTYTDNAEFFSTVDENMTVTGPMNNLRDNIVDMTIGGQVLKKNKLAAFDIIWSHIPFVDEVVILVKKAETVYIWKYLFAEFRAVVWVMLMFSFVGYAMFLVTVFGVQDRSLLVMNMFGALLLHGMNVRCKSMRYVLMFWVWFAFLISSHYLCSLTSLTTHPLPIFQISTEEDLAAYNMKACVSPMMRHVADVSKLNTYHENLSHGCDNLYQSMETVSWTEDAYTVGLSEVYNYYRHQFCDEFGCRLYMFPRPIKKVMYAIYMYKGFPMLNKLHKHVVRMREGGLITKAMDIIYLSRDMKNKVIRKEVQSVALIPWHTLVYGWILSAIVLVVEIKLGRRAS